MCIRVVLKQHYIYITLYLLQCFFSVDDENACAYNAVPCCLSLLIPWLNGMGHG